MEELKEKVEVLEEAVRVLAETVQFILDRLAEYEDLAIQELKERTGGER